MALLRLQPSDDADQRRALGEAVLLGQRATRLGVLVALEVDAVVDQLERHAGAALALELGDDRPTDRDQPIHRRRQPAQQRPIRRAPHAARVDGADHVRTRQAEPAELDRSARADQLGAVHVVVDDLRRPRAEQPHDSRQGCVVVRLIDHVNGGSDRAQPPHGRAVGEADDLDIEARRVEPLDKVLDVDLCAAAGAAGHELSYGDGHASADLSTSSRSIGSSTAPHWYLYDSAPRR